MAQEPAQPKIVVRAKDGTPFEVYDAATLPDVMEAIRAHNAALKQEDVDRTAASLHSLGLLASGRLRIATAALEEQQRVTWDADRLREFAVQLGKPATAAIRCLVDAIDPMPSADVAKAIGVESPKALGPIFSQIRAAAARLALVDPIVRKRNERGVRCLMLTPEFKMAALRARQPEKQETRSP